jgi:hypothetical protein
MARHGKKYYEVIKKIDRDQVYDPVEAIKVLKSVSYANFDETVEVHVRTGLDPRQADQQIRDVVVLPNGLGKSVVVLVFAQGEGADAARAAGADYIVDSEEMVTKIQNGWTEFDVAIATPDMMGTVGKLGRVLGPRGLMPNPKQAPLSRLIIWLLPLKKPKQDVLSFALIGPPTSMCQSVNFHSPKRHCVKIWLRLWLLSARHGLQPPAATLSAV